MLNPREFADKTGLSYNQVLLMCKTRELNVIRTPGGHFKIPEMNMERFTKDDILITKEEYLRLVKENEKMREILHSIMNKIKEAV